MCINCSLVLASSARPTPMQVMTVPVGELDSQQILVLCITCDGTCRETQIHVIDNACTASACLRRTFVSVYHLEFVGGCWFISFTSCTQLRHLAAALYEAETIVATTVRLCKHGRVNTRMDTLARNTKGKRRIRTKTIICPKKDHI